MKPLTDLDPMPFGLHKGKVMSQVPAQYLDWLRGQPDILKSWPRLALYIDKVGRVIDWELKHQ